MSLVVETFTAQGAGHWPGTGVDILHMALTTGRITECHTAGRTLEWFLPSVSSLVNLQCRCPGKPLTTDVALVWPLS